jgi:hypothetical protein
VTDYGLLLPFDTDDAEFVRGFEAGRIWSAVQTLDEDFEPESFTMHASNAEMAIRIAEATEGVAASCVVLDDHWIEVTFAPKDAG